MERKQRGRFYPAYISTVTWLLTLLVAIVLATTDARAGVNTAIASQPPEQPSVFPASSGIIAYVGNPDCPKNCRDNPEGASAIYTMDTNGGNIRQLTHDLNVDAPDIKPGGGEIAFGVGPGSIYIMDIDGSNQHPVTQTQQVWMESPTWSPDGSRLAYTYINYSDPQTINGIWTINADGTNPHPVTVMTGTNVYDLQPSWSTSGKIAFVRRNNDTFASDIYSVNADGSGLLNLTNTPATNETNPSWSPDGTKIAYTFEVTADFHIAVMNADGSNQHAITNEDNDVEPDWSPDGTEIVFVRDVDVTSSSDLFIIDQNGGNPRNITNHSNNASEMPSWAPAPIRPVVLVKGADGLPVEGAEVYNECAFIGTTGITGTIALTDTPGLLERFIARKEVREGGTQKGAHDGWAYHVWLTNIVQENDGSETVYVVTDTGRLTHTLVLSPTNAQIGFNIVASVEFNDIPERLGQIKAGFAGANKYLMDLTDGQMFFEQVRIYDNRVNWEHADFQFHVWEPRANASSEPDGISALTGSGRNIDMHSRDDFGVPYTQRSAQTTIVHEFAHYAIGAYDEYYKFNTDDYPTQCTLNYYEVDYDTRASAMFDARESSEFCATFAPIQHNFDTSQGYIQGESVWETLVDNWSDEFGLWELRSPISRGGEINPGPFAPICLTALALEPQVLNVTDSGCSTLSVKAVFEDGLTVIGADVFLHKGGITIEEGSTDNDGKASVLGASVGDNIHIDTIENEIVYNGNATVANCSDELIVTLRASQATGASPNAWPTHWLEAVPDWTTNRITITIQLNADPPAQPTLYASQDGANRRQVALTYNSGLHRYTGTYTFNPNLSPDFTFELERPVDDGANHSAYSFLGGQFHTGGPSGYERVKNRGSVGQNPNGGPDAWNLLRPESIADLIVNPSSLPDGTGVMVGETGFPATAPTNLIPVGGPYSVLGQHPLNGEVGIILSYQSEYFCGLLPGSASIYRYTGTGWEALPTTLIEDWHQAGATISQWGIYAVFAQPNPQVVFSDVPVGSTFYDYIAWMTCHGIASGYSDNTFRPNNNATRGQISKMISLAYQWYLEPPGGGLQELAQEQGGILWRGKGDGQQAYTFTDVPPGSTFFLYVEAAYREGVVSGYPCGSPGEPCDPQNRPYFRPSNNVTRGQIAKIIANGSKFNDPITGQTFEDVAPGSTFHEFVERMAYRSIINGYPCGGPGEPCGPGNRPYFRPGANATRGQLSKMIYLAAQPR